MTKCGCSSSHRANLVIFLYSVLDNFSYFRGIWFLFNVNNRHGYLGTTSKHWGRTHEGVGRHPRQDGGGLLHRFDKLQANLQTLRIHWRPILLEVIVTGMRHTEAKFQLVIGSHLAVIPNWKVAWWRGWCAFHFSRCRGWLFSVSRVTPRWTRVTHA